MGPVSRGMAELVDQHGYGVLYAELGLGTFETRLAGAAGAVRPDSGSYFHSGLGLAVRRWCPPLLGLAEHCSPAEYLARRRELGARATARMLLRGSGIRYFVVDTAEQHTSGPLPEQRGLSSPAGLAAGGGVGRTAVGSGAAVCLESLAGQVADTSGTVRSVVTNIAEALHAAARTATAFVSDTGFHEAQPPTLAEVHRAAARWLAARARRRGPGVPQQPYTGAPLERQPVAPGPLPPHALRAEPALVRHLLWSALVTGRPIQLRCGDPGRLAGFLRASSVPGSTVVLLPERGHHRTAAQLAAAFPHVYTDAGPCPAETLPEVPFQKLLFTSGARALPELYVVRARAFQRELGTLLTGWVADGACTLADAARIAEQLTSGTAQRIYRIPGSPDGAPEPAAAG